jgi:hypothetical protein
VQIKLIQVYQISVTVSKNVLTLYLIWSIIFLDEIVVLYHVYHYKLCFSYRNVIFEKLFCKEYRLD